MSQLVPFEVDFSEWGGHNIPVSTIAAIHGCRSCKLDLWMNYDGYHFLLFKQCGQHRLSSLKPHHDFPIVVVEETFDVATFVNRRMSGVHCPSIHARIIGIIPQKRVQFRQ